MSLEPRGKKKSREFELQFRNAGEKPTWWNSMSSLEFGRWVHVGWYESLRAAESAKDQHEKNQNHRHNGHPDVNRFEYRIVEH